MSIKHTWSYSQKGFTDSFTAKGRSRAGHTFDHIGTYRSMAVAQAAERLYWLSGLKLKATAMFVNDKELLEIPGVGAFTNTEDALQALLLQHALGDAVPFKGLLRQAFISSVPFHFQKF